MEDTTIEHQPHIGEAYHHGIDGNKIAIMGYSHWGQPDREDFTTDCIAKVRSGDWHDIGFFNQIASYFGKAADELWSRVNFLNFLPRSVGDDSDRYATGSEDDHKDARSRLLRLLEEYKPDMLFVFSRKAWKNMPGTLEDNREESGDIVLAGQQFDRHHYRTESGHVVQVFGLRHPQYAKKQVMTDAVASALKMQPNPPSGKRE